MNFLRSLLLILLLALLGGAGYVYSGVYDVGADAPHSVPVYWLLDIALDRSVERHTAGLQAPPLDDPQRIAKGASEYHEMCDGCHLAPGMENNEFRRGLYPQPPDLSKPVDATAAEEFWMIKHGIKMTAMPAWGISHDDATLWAIVAFLQKLPQLTPAQYQAMTAHTAEAHAEEHDSVGH
ncbi:MAG: cytochrome c [Nevskia sp.]|nr:cytochrome c [Nevskia sp.]